MLAANVWHWWIGVLLALGSAAAVLYPGKRQRSED
jgi:hypothetical protein